MKKLIRKCKEIGIQFRATGATFWLGAAVLLASALLHPPVQFIAAIAITAVLWATLCVISCIPDRLLVTGDPEKDKLKLRVKQEAAYAEETLKQLQEEQEKNDSLEGQNQSLENGISILEKQLFKQYCFRITERLRLCGLDNASWEFVSLEPEKYLFAGETVRLTLADAGEYSTADVSFQSSSGLMSIDLIKKLAPNEENGEAAVVEKAIETGGKPEEIAILKKWINENESGIEDLCYDAFSKGRDSLTLTSNLPPKEYWARLCGLLECDGTYESVTQADNGILICLKKWKRQIA